MLLSRFLTHGSTSEIQSISFVVITQKQSTAFEANVAWTILQRKTEINFSQGTVIVRESTYHTNETNTIFASFQYRVL